MDLLNNGDEIEDDLSSHLPKQWIGCDIEAQYFGDERKENKKERKIATAKDRSKFKKTDKKKAPKERDLRSENENLIQGRVLSIASQGITVDVDGETIQCMLRGALKKDKTESKNLVTVGDFVLFEPTTQGEGLIVHIEPRYSVLSRAENLSRRKSQLIAANIDQVIITVAVVSPPIKPSLIDRYIIAAYKGEMAPVIVVNKIDLLQTADDESLRETDREIFDEMLIAYKGADIPIIPVSTVTGEGIEELKNVMRGKASVFSGQSGVGKSSLINVITGSDLRIGGMVGKTKKGTHTTTTAQLLRLSFGGWCIDTPGIKSFGVWNLEKEEVEHYFDEIFLTGRSCRYPDCSHMGEEGCAVMRAVESGEISYLRFESYCALMDSVTEDHYRR